VRISAQVSSSFFALFSFWHATNLCFLVTCKDIKKRKHADSCQCLYRTVEKHLKDTHIAESERFAHSFELISLLYIRYKSNCNFPVIATNVFTFHFPNKQPTHLTAPPISLAIQSNCNWLIDALARGNQLNINCHCQSVGLTSFGVALITKTSRDFNQSAVASVELSQRTNPISYQLPASFFFFLFFS